MSWLLNSFCKWSKCCWSYRKPTLLQIQQCLKLYYSMIQINESDTQLVYGVLAGQSLSGTPSTLGRNLLLLWSEYEVSPVGSRVWRLDPSGWVLFWKGWGTSRKWDLPMRNDTVMAGFEIFISKSYFLLSTSHLWTQDSSPLCHHLRSW